MERLELEYRLVNKGFMSEVDRAHGALQPLFDACKDQNTGKIKLSKFNEALQEDHEQPDWFRGKAVHDFGGGDDPRIGKLGTQVGRASALATLGVIQKADTVKRNREAKGFHPGEDKYAGGLNDHHKMTGGTKKKVSKNVADLAIWARKELNTKCGHLKRAFNMFDDDESGVVNASELQKGIVKLGVLNPQEVQELFKLADTDANGGLNYAEFSSMLQDPYSRMDDLKNEWKAGGISTGGGEVRVMPEYGASPLADEVREKIYQKCGKLKNVWRMFDEDKSGEVDIAEMSAGLVKLGMGAPKEIDSLFKLVDVDVDGKVSYKEFAAALKDPDQQTRAVIPGEYKNKYGEHGGMADAHRRMEQRAQGTLDEYQGSGPVQLRNEQGKMNYHKQKGGKLAEDIRGTLDRKFGSLRSAFRHFDKDGSGEIEVNELEKGLKLLNYGEGNMKKGALKELFDTCDADGDGTMNYEEFASVLKDFDGHKDHIAHGAYTGDGGGMSAIQRGASLGKLHDERYMDQVKFEDQSHLTGPGNMAKDVQFRIKQQMPKNGAGPVIKQLFRSCNPDGCGYVSRGNFQKLCMESLGCNFEEAKKLTRIADRDQSGELDITGCTTPVPPNPNINP